MRTNIDHYGNGIDCIAYKPSVDGWIAENLKLCFFNVKFRFLVTIWALERPMLLF